MISIGVSVFEGRALLYSTRMLYMVISVRISLISDERPDNAFKIFELSNLNVLGKYITLFLISLFTIFGLNSTRRFVLPLRSIVIIRLGMIL